MLRERPRPVTAHGGAAIQDDIAHRQQVHAADVDAPITRLLEWLHPCITVSIAA